MDRRATAFAPGHLTSFFSVHHDDDPLRAGSRGAGITIDEGVTATVTSGEGVALNGSDTSIEAVERVLEAFDGSLRVAVTTELPLGMGFGVSGAAALATALAANEVLDAGLGRGTLVGIAHAADVAAGTGLGDVVAQAIGGAPIRIEPGSPPHGHLEVVATSGRVEYLALGTISTESVLAGDTQRLSAVGARCLDELLADPTLARLVDLGRTFAGEINLLDDELSSVIEAVEAAGGHACLGLLGRTVVALDDGLTRAGYDPAVSAIDPAGARLLDHD